MIVSLPENKIFAVFSMLSGEKDGEEFSLLCSGAGQSLLLRTRPTAGAKRWEDALCYAAGCLAFYRYTLREGSDNVAVYKAGDVNIRSAPEAAKGAAKALLDDALAALDGCLKTPFCFRVV